MVILENPFPVTLEFGVEKIPGFVVRITNIGIMVELDKIPFKAGTFVNAMIQLNANTVLIERVRSIKHYDQFFRAKSGKHTEDTLPSTPKMLCELHFQKLSEQSRVVITKLLTSLKPES